MPATPVTTRWAITDSETSASRSEPSKTACQVLVTTSIATPAPTIATAARVSAE